MFERFTRFARDVVISAQEHAVRLDHRVIGTEHLLLALLVKGGPAATVLTGAGLTPARVEEEIARLRSAPPARPVGGDALGPDDAAALRAIGIDLDEVRARIEENFGPVDLAPPEPEPRRPFWRRRPRERREPARTGGHRAFSPRAKKVLELSLREALRLKHNWIGAEHILLGLLREGEGLGAQVLAARQVDLADLRRRTEESLRRAA
jgi:ATP-dependent Clp protease ATP-binding subunit ClpA